MPKQSATRETSWMNVRVPGNVKRDILVRAAECDMTLQDFVATCVYAGMKLGREEIREQYERRVSESVVR